MRRLFLLILSAAMIFVCGGCYLAKQGTGLLGYQFRTVPINKMLKDDGITPETREFLLRVLDIREFAMDSLGLRRNKNYLKYVSVDKDYMIDVLVASKDDTFDLYKWWFPITGSVPYKGFFERKDAEKEARRITKKGGYDITIGKADAFSTLGITADPIYSFMVNYSVYDLASLIIHEQTHATVFIKNQIQLNEEMATFVGDVGGLLYIKDRFGEDSDEYRTAVLSKEDYRTYINLMREIYGELQAVYAADSSRGYKLAEKERIFGDFRAMVAESYDSLFRTPRYRGLRQAELNNAVIASRMTYNLDMSLFYDLYEKRWQDLPAAIRDLKGLKKIKKNHKDHLRGIIESR
ncbi:MAG: aminopeptidase [Chitinispirillia bacterium]|nr:aminopeptidase [Chitinispirillia bacterium]MCL2269224.1 aminopeptidase [Chitinispirillia bacterium]